jgi:hypothetical protein
VIGERMEVMLGIELLEGRSRAHGK